MDPSGFCIKMLWRQEIAGEGFEPSTSGSPRRSMPYEPSVAFYTPQRALLTALPRYESETKDCL